MLPDEKPNCIVPGREDLSALMSFGSSFSKTMRQGITVALADCPKCHFHMLERLYWATEKHGRDGKIYVSELSRTLHEPPPAVSRTLRMLESEGLITRETDPADRRKTFVAISATGEAARHACESAVYDYLQATLESFGDAHVHELLAEARQFQAAMEAETAKLREKQGQNQPQI